MNCESLSSLNIPNELIKFNDAFSLLNKNKIVLLLVLTHFKAENWPVLNKKLENDKVEIPILYGLMYVDGKNKIKFEYDFSLGKCLPNYYNSLFPTNKLSLIEESVKGTTQNRSGCGIYPVKVNKQAYSSDFNTYCSVFGVPDDCYYFDFEKIMIEKLRTFEKYQIYCYDETEYIQNSLSEFNISFIKDFLPSKYYYFNSSANMYLRTLYSRSKLSKFDEIKWYSDGYLLIKAFDIDGDSKDIYKYENYAIYQIRRKTLLELTRYLLLIHNKKNFEKFEPKSSPPLDLALKNKIESKCNSIIEDLEKSKLEYLNSLINKYEDIIDLSKMKKKRFIVIDDEFIRVSHPYIKSKKTNIPSIICNIIWHGVRKGFEIKINLFIIPCYYCKNVEECRNFRHNEIKHECSIHSEGFITKQKEFIQKALESYSGCKLYSYGRSDFDEIEHLLIFFSNGFEKQLFSRKNRKLSKRIVNIAESISKKDSLENIEKMVISPYFSGWKRPKEKINITKSFFTISNLPNWKENLTESIDACLNDVISALMLLIIEKFPNQ